MTSGKPYFKTVSYELYKYKHDRIFKCTGCKHTEKTQKLINQHYHSVHGLLKCPNCDKVCKTLSALSKHLYLHTAKAEKFSCEDCDKSYPFPSQLKSHRKVHLTALEHHCLKCDKSFKNKGELIKHQRTLWQEVEVSM